MNRDGVYPAGTSAKDYDYWAYERNPDTTATLVGFRDKMVSRISCASTVFSYDCPPVLGVRIGDAEDQVIAKLGQPSEKKLNNDTKTLSYPKLSLRIALKTQRVYIITLTNTQ